MDDNHLNEKFMPMTSISSGDVQIINEDIYCLSVQIVNVIFVGSPKDDKWVLIDAGMPRSAEAIKNTAKEIYGPKKPPAAIILTHGHFDHVGALIELMEYWEAPVYAHIKEMPYLTGQENYPEPDPTVEGGMVAKISSIFPNEGINLDEKVQPLPDDHSVPGLRDWKWVHTPGHSEGHISLFRESDRSLIVGDAFVNVRQDSLYKVITQEKEIAGPPRYLTTDWEAAKESVRLLESLKPAVAITGHGYPVEGKELEMGLAKLAKEFDSLAKPDHGKYVE
ncbi:MBL fold metallo-hydrolase [Peribacillus castrilensis]|uniref:Metallo-beta-lactamase family protein n=1 Tax=Peribacillus simplex TaxID=1478 RepID=A0AAN2TT48_9BACI|nr:MULTISPECIES: MBL fold metallo-hydrolase [Bacillaceae]MCP1097001.1 MBL fold metallo-hydrolase [Bacillaceae bacterium OS4b]MBD8589584.1 MBL fold metallo-hydrolase [Peribacillus simplex]MCF7622908.1 MBL fold metallo-hydrolase [Peribacillus frigoritolerans]MCP1153455.1 MBL fold metallo-hydrolase [Peribacillus frigoritolerans]MCT1389122.1 MBL fold metallo-hydrolase [Peribacillus frigoritolerans]